MNERLFTAISRLKAWVRDYGPSRTPEFIDDLGVVLEAAQQKPSTDVPPLPDGALPERAKLQEILGRVANDDGEAIETLKVHLVYGIAQARKVRTLLETVRLFDRLQAIGVAEETGP
jgi:hypothetical protein